MLYVLLFNNSVSSIRIDFFDGLLNILDVVSIVDLILNPQVSIQINSGTSYGECWGYCVFELQLDNSNALFTASGWGWYEFPDLLLEDNLSQEMWQQLVAHIDFEYFQSLDDVYGCPDCADVDPTTEYCLYLSLIHI